MAEIFQNEPVAIDSTVLASASTKGDSDSNPTKPSHADEFPEKLASKVSFVFPTLNKDRSSPKASGSKLIIVLACAVNYWIVTDQRIGTYGRHIASDAFPWLVGSGLDDSLARLSAMFWQLHVLRILFERVASIPDLPDPLEGAMWPLKLFSLCVVSCITTGFLYAVPVSIQLFIYLFVLGIETLSRSYYESHAVFSYLSGRPTRYRVSWICRCGTRFYGPLPSMYTPFNGVFISEVDRKWLGDYCEKLVCQSSVVSVTTALGTYSSTGWNANKTQISTSLVDRAHIRNLWRWLVPIGRFAAPVLPLAEIRPEIRAQLPPPSPYLLICLDKQSFAREMHHLNLEGVSSDKQLFEAVRNLYWRRRFNRITDRLRPSAIRAIRFVKFTLRRAQMVDNLAMGVMPKAEDDEYMFTPKPSDPTWEPPKGPLDNRYMLHLLLECPALLEEDVLCINQFPKKKTPLTHQYKLSDDAEHHPEHSNIGYGIYLQEGPHITRIYFLLLLGAVILSLVTGAIYRWAVKGSTSDTLAVLAVSLAVVMISGMMLTLYQADAKVDDD